MRQPSRLIGVVLGLALSIVAEGRAAAPGGGGGGPSPAPGIRSCGTRCQDSFYACVQGGANWNFCNAIYRTCLAVCQGTNQP